MGKEDSALILARIASSYARRELDRSFYDRVMQSPIGHRLRNLSDGQKYALEFAAYALSAVTLHNRGDSGMAMVFLKEVVADAPSEIARRMINGSPNFSEKELQSVLTELSMEDVTTLARVSEANEEPSPKTKVKSQSYLAELADKIDQSADRVRLRRKQREL